MPRIEKLVAIEDRFGVVLDIETPEGSVTLFTESELDDLLKKERKRCADIANNIDVKGLSAEEATGVICQAIRELN